METPTAPHFSDFLRQEFEKRQLRSRIKYSFRAFASELKVDASTLHHLMNGKRRAGAKRRRALLEKLGYDESRIIELLRSFEDGDGRLQRTP